MNGKNIVLALCTFITVATEAQIVKTVVLDYSLPGCKCLSDQIGDDEKYSLDSISISGGLLDDDWKFLADMTFNGNLTGIDLSRTRNVQVPDMVFGCSRVNAPVAKSKITVGMSKLKYISLPRTVRRIGYRAFCYSSLRCITIPKVCEIAAEAFMCPDLREVTMLSFTPPCNKYSNAFAMIPEGAVLNVPTGAKTAYASNAGYSHFGEIRELDGLCNIRGYYVDGQPLAALMGDDLFYTDSVKVGGWLTETDFETLGAAVCRGRLSGIDLSNCHFENDELPEGAFWDFPSASDWNAAQTTTYPYCLNYVRLPEGVVKLGIAAFQQANLLALDIPSSVKEIGERCFVSASIRGDLVIPEGVERIGTQAFFQTEIGGDIYLPSTLSLVGNNALLFSYPRAGTSPKNFHINRMTPPSNESGKDNTKLFPYDIRDCTLYVPVGAKVAYEADLTWRNFGSIVETPKLDGGTTGISDAAPGVAAAPKSSDIYTLGGQYVGTDLNALGSGVYVENGRKVVK